ncbi:MAG: hypothetical protein C7B44_01575 [Sulfobacillus thermosulfidooxidans]|nr:MAG: hypothetical protein C7B44_01575 [Sulfobacillus thermosulfidooxidans]
MVSQSREILLRCQSTGRYLGSYPYIEEVIRLLKVQPDRDAFSQSVLGNVSRILERLRPMIQQPLWAQIGPFTFMPTTSTVLCRRYGYQQIYHMYLDLLRSSRVAWSDNTVLTFLEGREVAQLYELWVYFSILREVNGAIGKPYKADRIKRSEWGAAVPYGYRVQWPNKTSLIYNWTYSRPRGTAYSVPLRPDITLEVGAYRHLFDAKFRRNSVTDMTVRDENEEEMEVALERQGDFLRGDIYKMHTYREAISNVDTVWICYPGAEFRFFSRAAVISDPADFANGSGGVGAIPLVPAAAHDELKSMEVSRTLTMASDAQPPPSYG